MAVLLLDQGVARIRLFFRVTAITVHCTWRLGLGDPHCLVACFIDLGIDVDAQSDEGTTALHRVQHRRATHRAYGCYSTKEQMSVPTTSAGLPSAVRLPSPCGKRMLCS